MLYEGTYRLQFQIVNDTRFIQAGAKSEPSGQCLWGNKYPQQWHSSVQHFSSAMPVSRELQVFREPKYDPLRVSLCRKGLMFHFTLGACETLLCFRQSHLSLWAQEFRNHKRVC